MGNVIACAGNEVKLSGVQQEIKILPLGFIHSQKGDFKVDAESITLICKQFEERNLDLVIDYEHQTLDNIQAPAGGWIKELYEGEDAIVAKVEWTPKATEYLQNKEYKYLSPVVLVRKKDQKAIAIHSVALTNTPAIDGMFALVNSVTIEDFVEKEREGETTMDLKKLAELLELPSTVSEEEILAALDALKKAGEKASAEKGKENSEESITVANSTILNLLGLKEDAKTEDVTASIMSLKVGDTSTKAEILALKQQMEERNAEELVLAALKSGKITAAQKEWAKAYALKDTSGFQSFVEKAPVVVPQGKLSKEETEQKQMDYNITILKNLGIKKEDAEKFAMKEDIL